MRTIFEQQPEVGHVYLGSRRHMMERLFNDENEPFWRSAKKVELGVIAPERFAGFIAKRFAAAARRSSDRSSTTLLERTGGHPYATQELCYFLWEQTPFDGAAADAELERALAAVLRSEHAHFQLRWDEASAAQKLLLEALAAEPGRPMTKPTALATRCRSVSRDPGGAAGAGRARARRQAARWRLPDRRAVPGRMDPGAEREAGRGGLIRGVESRALAMQSREVKPLEESPDTTGRGRWVTPTRGNPRESATETHRRWRANT